MSETCFFSIFCGLPWERTVDFTLGWSTCTYQQGTKWYPIKRMIIWGGSMIHWWWTTGFFMSNMIHTVFDLQRCWWAESVRLKNCLERKGCYSNNYRLKQKYSINLLGKIITLYSCNSNRRVTSGSAISQVCLSLQSVQDQLRHFALKGLFFSWLTSKRENKAFPSPWSPPCNVVLLFELPLEHPNLSRRGGGGVWIVLFSEVTLLEFNVSTILKLIVAILQILNHSK